MKYFIDNNYSNLLFLADTRYENCPNWCDEDWYKESLNEIRNFLLTQAVVFNYNKQPLVLQESLFPTIRGEEKLDDFWNICFGFVGKRIPDKESNRIWVKLLSVDYKPWKTLKYDLKQLLEEIQNFGNLKNLAEVKFEDNVDTTILWLKSVYDFIVNGVEQKELFDEFEIIPNQEDSGVFKKLEPLRYEIDEKSER